MPDKRAVPPVNTASNEADIETLRLHVYEAGNTTPASHTDVAREATLREILVIEETETVYRVGSEEILDLDIELIALFPDGPAHVIKHHCSEVEVTISYAGTPVELKVPPATHAQKVRADAIAALGISPANAADLELRIPGTEEDLNPAKPIGAYVAKGICTLTLDLVHIVRPQG
jgi:hypothetical protein